MTEILQDYSLQVMVLISMETDIIRYSTSQGDFWNQQAKGFHSRHVLNSFKHSSGFKNALYGTADFNTRDLENLQEAISFDSNLRFQTLLKKVVFAQLLFPVPLCVCRSCP